MTNTFLDSKDCIHLFVYRTSVSTLDVHVDPPATFNKLSALCFFKSQKVKVTPQNLHKVISFSNISQKPLESLSIVANEIFLPIVKNEHNTKDLTDQMSKEVTNTFSRFLADIQVNVGHSEGKTRLPIPIENVEDEVSSKNQIHSLETVVVTWTNQIKDVLKKDPELMFKDGSNPGPLDEYEFWENKALDLEAIDEQLTSEKVAQVIRVLQNHESQYIPQFMKLVQEVSHAKIEAKSNVHYLTPLKTYFEMLQHDSLHAVEFTELKDTFAHLFHLIYLVWSRSTFYNTPDRLVILIREIANDLIRFARHYNDSKEILYIEAPEAINKLDNTLAICGMFKKYYFAYKNKVDKECLPEKRWKVFSHALFHRLDQFMERCNDIKEVINLACMFSTLQEIEIGGTKGSILTAEIRSIHQEFLTAFQKFKEVPFDMLDVDAKDFEDHFYDFKKTVSELEKVVGSVVSKGFEDCAHISSAFKLIESFQVLLQREIIQKDLEKNTEFLIASYKQDLDTVQTQFFKYKNSPPTYTNMPPTAGALIWSQGLLDRIEQPLQKLNDLESNILQSDDGQELLRIQRSLVSNIKQFQTAQGNAWGDAISGIGTKELSQPLLIQDDNGVWSCNFDPNLTRLLKEVYYLEKFNSNRASDEILFIPDEARLIFENAEKYRIQTGQLGIIVNMWNKINSQILDVEKPLLNDRLETIEKTLERGKNELTWQSDGIDAFVEESLTLVKEVNRILFTCKRNITEIENILSKWQKHSLFERKETRTLTPSDFDGRYKEIKASREKLIREGASKIHKIMKSSLEAIGIVTEDSETWKNYLQYMSGILINGLCECVSICVQDLLDQIDETQFSKTDANPLLEIQLRINFKVSPRRSEFNPRLSADKDDENNVSKIDSIPKIVNCWISDFYETASYIERLEGGEGGYVTEVKENDKVKSLVNSVFTMLNDNSQKCFNFMKTFGEFSFLWERDQDITFKEFLLVNQEALNQKIYSAFEEQIAKYEKIEENLSTLPQFASIGWLRIDSRPIKNELKTLCSQWKAIFTNYLASQVRFVLDEMYTFMDTVGKGLDKDVVPGDVESLKEVISHIREVKKRVEAGTKTGIFKPLQEIADLLKSHNNPLPASIVEQLEGAPEKWNALNQKSLNIREKLSPLQDQEARKLKEQVLIFNKEVNDFRQAFLDNPAFFWSSGILQAYTSIDRWNKKLLQIEKQASDSRILQELFELTVVQYRELDECRIELKLLKELWDMISHIVSQFKYWMKSSFSTVDVDTLVDETKKIRKNVLSFNVKVRSWNCFKGMQEEVQNMLTSLPLVQELRSPAMRDRHWEELLDETKTTGQINPEDPNFSVRELLSLGLHNHVEAVRNIVNKASKELQIETALTKIEAVWKEMKFTFESNEELNCMTLGSVDEQIEELEDNQVKLQNISSVRYVDYFIARVSKWQVILGTVDSVIGLWKEVQATWSNLYPIFVISEDIRTQLPEDTQRFEGVDQRWRKLMEITVQIPNVVECCTSDRVKEHLGSTLDFLQFLQEMQIDLEKCEKALSDYLETKRRAFPRFYFVSPADLVDILSKGSFPRQVMHHMTKLVDAIETLEFENDSNVATGLISKEKEEIVFSTSYECKGAVENWLNGVMDSISDTLHNITGESHAAYIEQSREQWLYNFPAQVVITTSRMWFTSEVNNAFERIEEGNKNAMRDYHKQQVSQIAKLTQLVQGKLSSGDRRKIITLITVDVHNRDVVQKLIDEGADSSSVFTWQSQLRYSWDDNHGCVVNIADATFNYNYEYIGNCGCLVITPLTDRCYITLTQSLRLIMGGAPAGPAGTGKTETTKDLARALGNACFVFNCSSQMDYLSLGKIFKGLAMTGAWGCFDEFNRVRVGVLSVVATQFKSILDAIRGRKEMFEFQHEMITLKSTCGVFITMNPGYKGRTELPENLKALFRPCAMIVPDFENICEIMLASEGFIQSKMLAKKFVTLYQLNKELLSKQDHYDWGLRAIKSVLVIAGSLKRDEPNVGEELILMRALRDTNMAKLSADDISIFLRLIGDLFPGMEIQAKSDPVLVDAIKKAAQKNNLQTAENDMYIKKVVQFKELLDVRHSVFILGPAGSGKSCVWKGLIEAVKILGSNTWTHIMDPKAVNSFELYGYMHEVTRDWKDGLLSSTMREMSRGAPEKPKWIILDGDIDSEWIESMNTVMDDNKVLTLASNERIPLTNSMRMIFEISHLKNATPATVSRAGILFINSDDIGWIPFKESWIETRTDDREKQTLERLFDKYAVPTLEYLHEQRKVLGHIIPIREISMIQNLCYLLEGLLTYENCPPGSAQDVYDYYFSFACIWAFGGAFAPDEKVIFNNFWKKRFNNLKYPENGTVFDYFVTDSGTRFASWTELVRAYEYDEEKAFSEIVVQTAETARFNYLMDILINNGKPVLFVGTAGTGKTTFVKQKLSELPEKYTSATVNMNNMTDSASLQIILEQYIERKAGKRFAPPGRKNLIYFIDDLNMPARDKYGTQSAISLLRQHMEYKFWYNRNNMTLKEITNVQYIASMNPKAGSFTVDDRFQRYFSVFACSFPSTEDLLLIYGQILEQHFAKEQFPSSISTLAEVLIKESISLHKTVTKEFLPTAQKFHYQFNLRELSNLFQGLCLAKSEVFRSKADIIKLWIHESRRVFSDRMLPYDSQRFEKILQKSASTFYSSEEELNNTFASSILFTPLLKKVEGEKAYTLAPDSETLKIFLVEKLVEYNQDHAVMNLELFQQAIEHVCRISRILFNPRGNALLVGVGGSGKQSLARLSSYVCEYETYQITVSSNFSMNDFKESLMYLYRNTGLKERDFTFILTDSQIVNEHMLVYINDILSSGNIPDLFPEEQKEEVISTIQKEVRNAGLDYNNKSVCWDFFIERVRNRLHLVLCLSPVGPHFRTWCRKFPALINNTTIDWFHDWPEEALVSVARKFLSDSETEIDPELINQIAEHMAFVHASVGDACIKYKTIDRRHNYTTPKSYLELISLFKQLLQKKTEDLESMIDRLKNGLDKIEEAESKVSELEYMLKDEQVVVTDKQSSLAELLERVEREKEIVEKENAMARKEEEKTDALAKKAEEFAQECKDDLQKAEPIVRSAIEALQTLDKKEIQELKSFAKPKKEITQVTEAVLILISDEKRANRKFTWSDAKKMMQNPVAYIETLKAFDKDNIPEAKIKALQPYVSDPTFDPVTIKTISLAAAGLCAWVQNIVKYYYIYCEVEPKRQKLAEAEAKLATSQASLKKVQDKVKTLQLKLDQLIAEYNAALSDQMDTQGRADRTHLKLRLAGRLVGGLSEEKIRWADSIQALDIRKKTLIGDVLLSSAFLSYVGAFTRTYRENLLNEKWIPDLIQRKIPLTQNIDPLYDVLTNEAHIASWNNEGLPSDRVSIENGSIIMNCKRWPLLIDPQLQGVKWIKTKEEKNGLKVVQLNQKKYLDIIINAIRNGDPVLIENIGETIDSILDPLLSQSYVQKGRNRFIQLGDKEIDYNTNFKLYLQTKLSNPHYRPEIVAQTTLLNFMVTETGLEDQLLSVVVNKERPDLEAQRIALLRKEREFKITLKKCEDDLLNELTNAVGDPLENQSLVENLEHTKATSKQIQIAVKETKETSEMINNSRQVYKSVSNRGSMLYFLIDQLSTIDHMYQYSLEAFMVMFIKALEKAEQDENVDKRVQNIIESITDTLFNYVSRGLFERHKLIFSALLCFSIERNNIDKTQLEFLLRGTRVNGEERPENVLSWCSTESWAAIQALSSIEGTNPPFSSLPLDMNGSWRRWKEWCEFEKPEEKPLPLEWKALGQFEKLLVIRCLRPDRLTMAISNFVRDKIGTKYVSGFTGDLKSTFEDSSPSTPIFFILSPGVDPVKSVENLGTRYGFSSNEGNFKNISLGEGQEPIAEVALDTAFRTGGWVMLNNLHLTPEWLPSLEKKLDYYDAVFARQRLMELNSQLNGDEEKANAGDSTEDDDNIIEKGHKNFRVFLSAEPSQQIPIGILQRSIKLTSEPPGGLRANLNRALAQFSDQTWDGSSKQTEFKAVMFALCFFHSVIVERKKFGPQGWNRNYPFSLGDLTTCVNVLNNYLEDKPKVPWDDLIYVFGEIMYGGHITDDWDRKLCMTYLRSYIRPELIETIELCPGFQSPPSTLSHKGYLEFVEENLPSESPTTFGLHPNAEIGFRTIQGENLLRIILEMQPRTADEESGEQADQKLRATITHVLDHLPEKYNMDEISEKLGDDRNPFQNSFYQECEYMNELLGVIERSLTEVLRAIDGELTISEEIQSIMDSILLNQVPEVWNSVSYPSMKMFDAWIPDLLKRCHQLTNWTEDLSLPKVVWISGFFNPQSFLTAIMQSTARKMQWPLDKMVLVAEVTKKANEEGIDSSARDGAYIHGLYLEGAAWDIQSGSLTDAKLKELHPLMPVLHIKAQQVDKSDPASHYDCPVYKTQERGPHYVTSFKLKTKEKSPNAWIQGGVACLMEVAI